MADSNSLFSLMVDRDQMDTLELLAMMVYEGHLEPRDHQ